MNLVCFPNNTGGALVCDLLNHKRSEFCGYKIQSTEHNAFKVNDTPTVQFTLNINEWNNRISKFRNTDQWLGTHAHPTAIPDITIFQNVMAITTGTRSSKLYRWLRYYHGWFLSVMPDWEENNKLETIDKVRELAKNVFVEFTPYNNCTNIEFDKIVNGDFINEYKLDQDYFEEWKQLNPWLYSSEITWAERRFNEAEWELQNNQPYKYI
jgi:hypothetical protein